MYDVWRVHVCSAGKLVMISQSNSLERKWILRGRETCRQFHVLHCQGHILVALLLHTRRSISSLEERWVLAVTPFDSPPLVHDVCMREGYNSKENRERYDCEILSPWQQGRQGIPMWKDTFWRTHTPHSCLLNVRTLEPVGSSSRGTQCCNHAMFSFSHHIVRLILPCPIHLFLH